jgi:threonine/homoserine/homoserine lactone efflux protein
MIELLGLVVAGPRNGYLDILRSVEITFFLKGLAIGVVIAVPVGPIGILCARRVLTHGRRAGFLSGIGAATADVIYGFVAAFGLGFISDIFQVYQFWLRLAGGSLLCVLGIKTFMEKPKRQALLSLLLRKKKRHAAMYASTFFFTLTNPITIFSFAAVFAGFGIVGTRGSVLSASVLVLGVFLGSVLWWLAFVGVFTVFKTRLKRRELQSINRIAGLIIAGFGAIALVGAILSY